jgi:predicted alpha-1,6-mannanase (GH76 family)
MTGPAMDPVAASRAHTAAASVDAMFGSRLLRLPWTYLPQVTLPRPRGWSGSWNYWWQAHVLDALVDSALRESVAGSPAQAEYAVRRAHRLLRTIRLRNTARFPNHYYDDMAWLLVATQRLVALDRSTPPRRAHLRLTTVAGTHLRDSVNRGDTPDLGGGVFWNDSHDFKNVPATAPVAIYHARTGDRARASALVDWVYARLVDPDTGLALDGVRIGAEGALTVVRDVYTYNQGVVLGALLAIGDPRSLARAAALVQAVDRQLTVAGPRHTSLRTHGGGDGGLFTGILARYLALAANAPTLDELTRQTAARLVAGTADALWEGRDDRRSRVVFSPDPQVPAAQSQPPGIPVELSTQTQAWTILEAAATLP